jgi:hypothetical protein
MCLYRSFCRFEARRALTLTPHPPCPPNSSLARECVDVFLQNGSVPNAMPRKTADVAAASAAATTPCANVCKQSNPSRLPVAPPVSRSSLAYAYKYISAHKYIDHTAVNWWGT